MIPGFFGTCVESAFARNLWDGPCQRELSVEVSQRGSMFVEGESETSEVESGSHRSLALRVEVM